MKYSPLLPQVALVFAVVYACTDSTAPARFLTPKDPAPAVLGDPPPPPVDAAIFISVASDVLVGGFTGVYFANGATLASSVAATEVGDLDLLYNGTAWLRLDKVQTLGPSASANARFQISNGKLFGRGTLVIADDTVTIDAVTSFVVNPDCFIGAPCATITFDASVNGVPGHHGTAQAFDREVCTYVTIPEEEEGSFFFCPFGGSE